MTSQKCVQCGGKHTRRAEFCSTSCESRHEREEREMMDAEFSRYVEMMEGQAFMASSLEKYHLRG